MNRNREGLRLIIRYFRKFVGLHSMKLSRRHHFNMNLLEKGNYTRRSVAQYIVYSFTFRVFSLYGTSIIDRLIIYSTHNGHESLQRRPAAKEDKVVPLRDLFRVVNYGLAKVFAHSSFSNQTKNFNPRLKFHELEVLSQIARFLSSCVKILYQQ